MSIGSGHGIVGYLLHLLNKSVVRRVQSLPSFSKVFVLRKCWAWSGERERWLGWISVDRSGERWLGWTSVDRSGER
jgi:hypothetical protein